MKLPQQLGLQQMQNVWAAIIEPIINKPSNNSLILKNISLVAGSNTINHRLGRNLQGWNPVRIRSNATLYDQQDSNQTPQLTLILVASADVVCDIMVF
jgi:hypothetical protein